MTGPRQFRAEKIVARFRKSLPGPVAEQISDSTYEELALMIREAMNEEASLAAELLEQVVDGLRAETEKPELGL